jgi:hypothetical protein
VKRRPYPPLSFPFSSVAKPDSLTGVSRRGELTREDGRGSGLLEQNLGWWGAQGGGVGWCVAAGGELACGHVEKGEGVVAAASRRRAQGNRVLRVGVRAHGGGDLLATSSLLRSPPK